MDYVKCGSCKEYFHERYTSLVSASKFFLPIVYICDFCSLGKQFSACDSCGWLHFSMDVSYSESDDCMICDDCCDIFGYETVKSKKRNDKQRNIDIMAFQNLVIEVDDG